MSTVEERVNRAMSAASELIDGVPPLRLAPAPGARGRSRDRRGAARRSILWAAPLAAAAVIVALAISLVTLREISNGSGVTPGTPTLFPDGVPRYYAALVQAGSGDSAHEVIVIGDTRTGKRLGVVEPPAGSTFAGITGAADDRTFVVDTQPLAAGGIFGKGQQWRPRTWYQLRISPWSARPAQLTKIPIPRSVQGPNTAQGTNVDAIALSPDGTQLALAVQPDAVNEPGGPLFLNIYSVATGAIIRTWASNQGGLHFGGPKYSGPDRNLALAWTGDGSALAFGWSGMLPGKTADGSQEFAQIRLLPTGTGGADLILASRPVLSLVTGARKPPSPLRCGVATLDRIVLATDLGALACEGVGECRAPGPLDDKLCAAGPAWDRLALLEYSLVSGRLVRVPASFVLACAGPQVQLEPLWSSADGRTQLGFLGLRPQQHSDAAPAFGIFRDGSFTPLPMPATNQSALSVSPVDYIAW